MDDKSDLSDLAEKYWNINGQSIGANCVSVSSNRNQNYTTFYIDGKKIKIPDLKVKFSDNKYGVKASTR